MGISRQQAATVTRLAGPRDEQLPARIMTMALAGRLDPRLRAATAGVPVRIAVRTGQVSDKVAAGRLSGRDRIGRDLKGRGRRGRKPTAVDPGGGQRARQPVRRLFRAAAAVTPAARNVARDVATSEDAMNVGRAWRVRPAHRVRPPRAQGSAGVDQRISGRFSRPRVTAPSRARGCPGTRPPAAVVLIIVLRAGLAPTGLVPPTASVAPVMIVIRLAVARGGRSPGSPRHPLVASVTAERPPARPTVVLPRIGRRIGVVGGMPTGGPRRMPHPTGLFTLVTNGVAMLGLGTNAARTGTPPVVPHNGRRRGRTNHDRASRVRASHGRPALRRVGGIPGHRPHVAAGRQVRGPGPLAQVAAGPLRPAGVPQRPRNHQHPRAVRRTPAGRNADRNSAQVGHPRRRCPMRPARSCWTSR